MAEERTKTEQMEIINAREEYAGQIEELLQVSFGSNYMSLEQIKNHMKAAAPFMLAAEGKKLMGLILFISAGADDIVEHIKMDKKEVEKICGGKEGLICKCACTYDEFQGKGVGKAILDQCLAEIEKKGYGAIFTTLWKYNGTVPAEKMFIDCSFVKGKDLTMPWYHDYEYVCGICKGRCRCDGIVYYKRMCV